MTEHLTGIRPALSFRPDTYAFRDINMKFANGAPLTPAELNFIYEYHGRLTFFSHRMDELLKYYLRHTKDTAHHHLDDPFDKEAVEKFRRHLVALLKEKGSHVRIKLKPEQFLQMRAMTTEELILYHGNQFLSGAPFYPGGVPHTIYFQWGNLFGVAKYVVLPEERALKSNILIYFEDKHERYLDQCIKDYELQLASDLHQHKQNNPQNELAATTPSNHPLPAYSLPRLTLSINTGGSEKKD